MRYWIVYATSSGTISSWLHLDSDNSITWTNISTGCAVLCVTQPTLTTDPNYQTELAQWNMAVDAATDQIHMTYYNVQNGALVSVVTPAHAQLLAEAQAQRIALIEAGLMQTLVGGFTSKSTTHTYSTDSASQANFIGGITVFTTNPNKTSITLQTLDAGWVNYTKGEFYAMYNDGDM